MTHSNRFKIPLYELKQKWQQLQKVPKVFAYSLNVSDSKYLPGKYGFYAELNPERTALRRPPQTILSLDPPFDEEQFNFKKINPQECLLTLPYTDNVNISLIINKSPLTKYHTLICPNVSEGLPQRITLQALTFCMEFLMSLLDDGEMNFRIGYNSPGALASVNHLHLHLMFIDKNLYIDDVKLRSLIDDGIYRFDETMPTEAICFQINPVDTEAMKTKKLENLNQFIQWLCTNNIPHNIFMTPDRIRIKEKNLKIFVFARKEYCVIKDLTTYNIGFCELAGYMPVGSREIFEQLNETDIVQRINNETGDVLSKIYSYFSKNI
ncbi:GDP-D-glucose phosphorylase 1 [Haematobia irritans]|uniref:GDP-D-glucose phosphorylase 1 n=1 Tax=Haematobia irritans TaxID=7368 RepID=UPI003F4F7453